MRSDQHVEGVANFSFLRNLHTRVAPVSAGAITPTFSTCTTSAGVEQPAHAAAIIRRIPLTCRTFDESAILGQAGIRESCCAFCVLYPDTEHEVQFSQALGLVPTFQLWSEGRQR